MIDYSVIIRTTGQAGEKYKKLLESIKLLVPQPKEVIVVLPSGYKLPEEQLGWETFSFSPKGMVAQRIHGIQMCKTQYALITDDDISFETDFVQKLYKPLSDGKYGISAGPLLDFLPEKGLPMLAAMLTGAAIPTILHKDRYNTVLRTTGYSYNRKIKIGDERIYETQSGAWTCFFADIYILRSTRFEDELWLDKNGYSAHDDTAMFYKAWIRGVKSIIVANAEYKHLNAQTSTRGNREKVMYATGFNIVVFWHRFLRGNNCLVRIWSEFCINYRIITQKIYNRFNVLRNRMTLDEAVAFTTGTNAAWKWITTKEYNDLPDIMEN